VAGVRHHRRARHGRRARRRVEALSRRRSQITCCVAPSFGSSRPPRTRGASSLYPRTERSSAMP
jgi:hypothetical protein